MEILIFLMVLKQNCPKFKIDLIVWKCDENIEGEVSI